MKRNSRDKRKKVISPNITLDMEKQIPDVHPQSERFRFITVYDWLECTEAFLKKRGFTNALKDEKEFSEKISYVIRTLIPKINEQSDDIFIRANNRSDFRHCHLLTGDQLDLAQQISRELNGDDFAKQTDDSFKWWQLGFTRDERIVGIFSQSENCFYPIFCDWHHLLFPSQKHNMKDYKQYHFRP